MMRIHTCLLELVMCTRPCPECDARRERKTPPRPPCPECAKGLGWCGPDCGPQ